MLEPEAGVRVRGRWLILALGVLAGVPIVVAAVHAIVVRWVPTGDHAYYAVHAFDVFTSRSPLVGPWSSGATAAAGEVVYSPGPMLFWLMALPARFFDESAIQAISGLVNLGCLVGLLAVAWRRGGWPLLVATAVSVPLMMASLPPEPLSDVWNSSAPLLPFTLLVFLCWSLACGEFRLLPAMVLVASFASQTHLTFAVPTAGVVLVGLVGLAVSRPWRGPDPPGRWFIAAALIAVLCWVPAVIDQATNQPGNLSRVAEAAGTTEATLGAKAGWHAVVHTVGIPPWWLQGPRGPLERIGDLATGPGIVATASTFLLLLALAAVTVAGCRQRRADVCAAGALGLVLCAAVAIDAASTPKDVFATAYYTLRWASPAGMCVWLLLGWSLPALRFPGRQPVPRRGVALAALMAVGAIGAVVAISADFQPQPYRQLREFNQRVEAQLPDDGATRVDSGSFDAITFKAGTIYALRRAGKEVVSTGTGPILGDDYDASQGFKRTVRIDVVAPSARADNTGRRLARLTYEGVDGSERAVTATLLRTPVP